MSSFQVLLCLLRLVRNGLTIGTAYTAAAEACGMDRAHVVRVYLQAKNKHLAKPRKEFLTEVERLIRKGSA